MCSELEPLVLAELEGSRGREEMASEIAGLGRLRTVAFVLSMVKLQESGLGETQAARLPVILYPAGDVFSIPSFAFGVCVQLLSSLFTLSSQNLA